MIYKGERVFNVLQNYDGDVKFEDKNTLYSGEISVYGALVDTRNGGMDQNEIWLRVGSNPTDLTLAKNIFAAGGGVFHARGSYCCHLVQG
jgi:hypothetical protein